MRLNPELRPRLGFLGVGWIGRNRLEAIGASGVAGVHAISDPSPEMLEAASAVAPGCVRAESLDALLDAGVDGVVIATPSALHAEQALRGLERGAAVFCQKPLGRTAAEVERVVDAAKQADRLLGVDLSYRHTAAMQALRPLIAGGEMGDIHAVELVFHNAYGPDKQWFYDSRLSGGGCVMDLGVHLVDLALWSLGFPEVVRVTSSLLAAGKRFRGRSGGAVEDYATAELELASGAVVRLACSWRLPAGQEAVIEASFYGNKGGGSFRNVNGSFYDFVAERFHGTTRERLVEPPDAWGGRAAVAWARELAAGRGFDPSASELLRVARVLDRIYGP